MTTRSEARRVAVQLSLGALDEREPTFDEALAAGWLEVIVDPERELGDRPAGFVGSRSREARRFGEDAFAAREPVRWVHVIHVPRRMEMRGYALIRGRLHLRLPSYTGEWPEFDAWIAAHLGVQLVPYRLTPGGGDADDPGPPARNRNFRGEGRSLYHGVRP